MKFLVFQPCVDWIAVVYLIRPIESNSISRKMRKPVSIIMATRAQHCRQKAKIINRAFLGYRQLFNNLKYPDRQPKLHTTDHVQLMTCAVHYSYNPAFGTIFTNSAVLKILEPLFYFQNLLSGRLN